MCKTLTTIVFFIAAVAVNAQTKTFRWQSGMCDHAGAYNSKKYTLEQLRNTQKLFIFGDFNLSTDATVWKYEDIAKLSVAALDRDYDQKSAELKALKIVNAPFWENLRRAKLKELEQLYRLKRLTMQAYTNPAVLRDYEDARSCKLKYIEPLILGGENLVGAWRQVNIDSQKKNAGPARLQRRFDEENASPDRLKFALVETMSFGWWNCANNFIDYEEKGSDRSAEAQFKKLFIQVKSQCDEP